ncbi:MAG: transposase, partial [Phycisphaerae bacterium]|nr:transposase [Phycisphaerae bacterium]
ASYKADILAWCLMRHHFNLLIVPLKKDSLPRVIGRTLFDYSNYIAKKRKIVAPFWHNRFQSCIIDDKLRSEFARYVECQPVYEGRVQVAEEYRWSSAQAHITWEDEHGLLSLNTWPLKRSRNTWSKTLAKKLDEATRKKIRIHTQTGRPMGSDKFIASLEKKFKRSLKPMPVGRPRLNQE